MSKISFPTEVSFLLCEDIRNEPGNKQTLLGVMGGGNLKAEQPIPKGELSAVERLALFIVMKGGEGVFKLTSELISPEGVPEKRDLEESFEIKKGQICTVNVKFSPFPIRGLGVYKFKLILDGSKEYEYEFKLDGEYQV